MEKQFHVKLLPWVASKLGVEEGTDFIFDNSKNKEPSLSENGMSGAVYKVCTGMGAQRDGCN